MDNEFTREELYELVWREPKRSLAEKLGVSDVAIGKTCRKAGIPVPERGYWARKDAGKPTIQPSLPPRFPGLSNSLTIGAERFRYSRSTSADLLNQPLPPAPEFSESLASVRERVTKIVGKVAYPIIQSRSHPLIKKLLAKDDERRKEYQIRGYHWDKPHFDTPIQKRRLRIYNAIFLATQQISCKPEISTSSYEREHNSATVYVGDQSIHFTLKEISSTTKKNDPSKDNKSYLALSVANSHVDSDTTFTWQDSKDSPIEKSLTEIVIAIVLTGEMNYRAWVIHQHEWLIKHREDLLEAKRLRIIAEEKAAQERKERQERERIEQLLSEADSLIRAEKIRDYVEKVLANAENIDTNNDKIQEWAAWALGQADRIDPIIKLSFISTAFDVTIGS